MVHNLPLLCYNQIKNREVKMFRSVTESGRAPIRQRIIHWAEGVVVAAGIISLLLIGLGTLMTPGY